MKNCLYLLVFTITFLFSTTAFAQIGTQFWFAPPDVTDGHSNSDDYIELHLTSASNVPVTVSLSQPANPGSPVNNFTNISIGAGQSYDVNMSQVYGNYRDNLETYSDGSVKNSGLLVSSTGPITAYYEVGRASSVPGAPDGDRNGEIFTLKGANALGTHFFTPFQNVYENLLGGNSSIDIVASQDNTTVNFRLTKTGISGGTVYNPGQLYSITLNKGQTYSIRAISTAGIDHMSGSEVTSDKPIAVTQKDDSIGSNWGGPSDQGIDIIGDQLVPANVVGSEYIVVRGFLGTNTGGGAGQPPYDRNEVFIVPVQNGTDIQVDGVTVATGLNAGDLFTHTLSSANGAAVLAERITSSQPVYVYYVSGFGAEMGGPLLPPVQCTGSNTIGFVRSSPDPFFLTILARSISKGDFLVQGNPNIIVASDFIDIGNGWVVAQKRMDADNLSSNGIPVNQGITIQNTSGYFHLGIINGLPVNETARFGYFSDYGKIVSNLPANVTICPGTSIPLVPSVLGLDSSKTEWYLLPNATTPEFIGGKFNATKKGTYKVILTDQRNCVYDDTLTLGFFTLSPFNLGKAADTVCANQLDPIKVNGTWDSIFWAPVPAGVNIPEGTTSWNATVSGSYGVTVKDVNKCVQKSSINITYDTTGSKFDLGPPDLTVCGSGSSTIQVPAPGNYTKIHWVAKPPVSIPDGTASYAPQQSGWYKVIVTSKYLCVNSDSVDVSYVNKIDVNFGGDSAVSCENNKVTLTAPFGNFTYSWTKDGVAFANSSNTFSPTVNGLYKVVVVSKQSAQCSGQDQSYVTVPPPIDLNFAGDSAIACNGANFKLCGGAGYSKYDWSSKPAGLVPSGTGACFGPTVNGKYFLTITDKYKCNKSDSIYVTSPSPIVLDFGGDSLIACDGANFKLCGGTGYTKYDWSSSPAGLVPSGIGACFAPTVNGKYSLTITDKYKCSKSDTAYVTVPTPIVLNFGGDSAVSCNGANFKLCGGTGYAKYVWSSNPAGLIPSGTGACFAPIVNGKYFLTITDKYKCSKSDSVYVTSPTPIVLDFGGDSLISCENANFKLCAGPGYVKYDWKPAGVVPVGTKECYSPLASGRYSLTVTDKYKCQKSDSAYVTVPTPIDLNFKDTSAVACYNSGFKLCAGDNAGYVYKWSSIPANLVPAGTKACYEPKTDGRYFLTITDQYQCVKSDSIHVKYPGKIDLGLGNKDTASCYPYKDYVIRVPQGYDTYSWFPNTATTGFEYTPVFGGDTVQRFVVTVTKEGCTATDSVSVKYIPEIKFPNIPGGDTTACGYAHYTIRAGSGFLRYEWSNDGVAIANTDSIFVPTASGKYAVTVYTTRGGCKNTSAVSNVKYVPTRTIPLGDPVTFCRVGGNSITALDAGPGFDRYEWENNPSFNQETYLPDFPNIGAGSILDTVFVKAWYERVCMATASKQVLYIRNDSLAIVVPQDTVCTGEAVVLTPGPGFTAYFWYTSDAPDQVFSTASSITVTKPGTYIVAVSSVCQADPVSKTISNYPVPALNIGGPDTTVCVGKNLDLINVLDSSNIYTYSWKERISGVVEDSKNKILSVSNDGVYYVTATDKHQCTNTDSIHVITSDVGDCFKIPNLITPNSDGHNEAFFIDGIWPDTWHLEIYNRWGDRVYESKGYNNNWGADNVSDGVYYYHLQHPTKDRKYKGWLQVTR